MAGPSKKFKAIPPLLGIRADVALLCSRMKYEQALTGWQRGFDLVAALPVSPEQKRLKDGWMEWQAEIRERQLAVTNSDCLTEARSAEPQGIPYRVELA